MTETDKKLIVKLVGGLGNQLYQIVAGLYFSESYNRKLAIEVSEVEKSHDKKGIFEYVQILDLLESKKVSIIDDYEVHGISTIADFGFLKTSELISQSSKSKILLNGYFQEYYYVDKAMSFIETLTPKNVCPEHEEIGVQIRKKMPIIVHIRRGDYLHNQQIWGILGVDYYERAISSARRMYPNSEIFVFSDSLKLVKKEFRKLIKDYDLKLIKTNFCSSAACNLSVMRLSDKYICSNSTYSAWSTYHRNVKMVIYPEPFYKSPSGLEIRRFAESNSSLASKFDEKFKFTIRLMYSLSIHKNKMILTLRAIKKILTKFEVLA